VYWPKKTGFIVINNNKCTKYRDGEDAIKNKEMVRMGVSKVNV